MKKRKRKRRGGTQLPLERFVGDLKKKSKKKEENIMMIRTGKMPEVDVTTTPERRGGSASYRGVSTQKTQMAL